jgi:putative hydrolase
MYTKSKKSTGIMILNNKDHLAPEPTFDLNEEELSELASLTFSNHKIIELNAKYHRSPRKWLLKFKEHDIRFHLGSNAHSLQEIWNFSKISDLIAIVQDDSRNSKGSSSSPYQSIR